MKCLLLLLLSFSLLTGVSAQSKYRSSLQDYYMGNSIDGGRFLQRISIGGGILFINGKADLHFKGLADSINRDTVFNVSTKAKQSYIFHAGSYFPIAIISDNSMVVLNMEFMVSISSLVYDSAGVSQKNKFLAPFTAIRAGMPVSLEYRLGGDVRLNKSEPVLFTIGAGFTPGIINSTDYSRNIPLKLTPFIKAETGFFAGLAFKIRGVINFGQTEYAYNTDYNVAPQQSDKLESTFKGGLGYSAALIIMPFSVMWNR